MIGVPPDEIDEDADDRKTSGGHNDRVPIVDMSAKDQSDEREHGDKKQQDVVQFHYGAVIAFQYGEKARMRHPEPGYDEKSQSETDKSRRVAAQDGYERLTAGRDGYVDQIQDKQGDGKGKDAVGKAQDALLRPSDAITLLYDAFVHAIGAVRTTTLLQALEEALYEIPEVSEE